jgi:hypothetical protein
MAKMHHSHSVPHVVRRAPGHDAQMSALAQQEDVSIATLVLASVSVATRSPTVLPYRRRASSISCPHPPHVANVTCHSQLQDQSSNRSMTDPAVRASSLCNLSNLPTCDLSGLTGAEALGDGPCGVAPAPGRNALGEQGAGRAGKRSEGIRHGTLGRKPAFSPTGEGGWAWRWALGVGHGQERKKGGLEPN